MFIADRRHCAMHSYGTPQFFNIWLKKLFEKTLVNGEVTNIFNGIIPADISATLLFGSLEKFKTFLTNINEAVSAKLPLKTPNWFFKIVFKAALHYQSNGNRNEPGEGVLDLILVCSSLALLRKLDFITLRPKNVYETSIAVFACWDRWTRNLTNMHQSFRETSILNFLESL